MLDIILFKIRRKDNTFLITLKSSQTGDYTTLNINNKYTR